MRLPEINHPESQTCGDCGEACVKTVNISQVRFASVHVAAIPQPSHQAPVQTTENFCHHRKGFPPGR